MKILKTTILILSTLLISCQKDDVLILPKENSLKNSQWLNIPGGYASFIQFDFNNDNLDDVVLFDGYDLNLTYNWPGPQFYTGIPLTKVDKSIDNTKIFGSKLIAADFDGNGYKDIFVMSGMDPANCSQCSDPILPNSIIFNRDGKSFYVKELSDWKGIWRSSTSGDIDNDGDIDLLIFTTHQGKGIYNKLLINDGKGNFYVRESDIDNIEWVDAVEMADINKDGYLDLLINDIVNTGNRFRILWGNGINFSQTKSTLLNIRNDMSILDIDVFDFDNDKFAEIIIAMNLPNGKWNLEMFKTHNNSDYINANNQIADNNPIGIAYSDLIQIGDIDGNGKIDVYANNKSLNIRWEFDNNILKRK